MSANDEFRGVGQWPAGERPVMSRPPDPIANKVFVDEVRHALGIEGDAAVRAADWILGKMERYAAWHAQPVFTLDGNGPVCSLCGTLWPLCGHHHLSGANGDHAAEDGAA